MLVPDTEYVLDLTGEDVHGGAHGKRTDNTFLGLFTHINIFSFFFFFFNLFFYHLAESEAVKHEHRPVN